MHSAVALLISLSIITVHGQNLDLESTYIDYGDDYTTEAPGSVSEIDDWWYDYMIDTPSICDPNPCFNGGLCSTGSDSDFECTCPEPYTGRRCQRVKNVCENVKCGRGDCVINLKEAPYYECKCNPPFQGPNCMSLPSPPCEANVCQNGASCVKGNRRFRCICPDGYTGRFCENAPSDCYEGNGESYRGSASETEQGEQCLNWHSHFIIQNGRESPFITYSDFGGLEFNNECRNPDRDDKPWCFVKRNGQLRWDYCKVKKCSEDPTVPTVPTAPTTPSAPVTTVTPAQFSQCGKPHLQHPGRIFLGTKSLPRAHPWQASVQNRTRGSSLDFRHLCGGTLIKSCWVLTAAHCIFPDMDYQVLLGGVRIDKEEETDQTIPVERIITHENYRRTDKALYNDIALLQLKHTNSPYCAQETPSVKTACLPDQTFPARKECVVSGWGLTETYTYSNQLLHARIRLISQERCSASDAYGDILDDSMFCAGIMQGGIDSCQGDSGGPLVCDKDGVHYVSGVVSWGWDCAVRNQPGVYANVHGFMDWINSQIN